MIHCGMCSVYERILISIWHLQSRERLVTVCLFCTWKKGCPRKERRYGGFYKIICLNFMYLTSEKLPQQNCDIDESVLFTLR